LSGIRPGAAAFENGVTGQCSVYATQVLDARIDSVSTISTLRSRFGSARSPGTGAGVRMPGWTRAMVSL
jgi:hypothetical protein